jgi:hypothetical protein
MKEISITYVEHVWNADAQTVMTWLKSLDQTSRKYE